MSTPLAESRPPEEVARLLSRFYITAAGVLYKHDAFIDKFVGDEVMALFLTGFTGPACFDKMAAAAEGILKTDPTLSRAPLLHEELKKFESRLHLE